jgi:hypothetical protein
MMLDVQEKRDANRERFEKSEREKRIAAYAADVESGRDIEYVLPDVCELGIDSVVGSDDIGNEWSLPDSWYLEAAQDIADGIGELVARESEQGFCKLSTIGVDGLE